VATTSVPHRIVLGLEPEARAALARSASDHHRPVAYEAEHMVVEALIENGYLEAGSLPSDLGEYPHVVEG
jgi:hypothetical protein